MSEQHCPKCGEVMVCRCGQTESSMGWPCAHGGCLFECQKCEREGDYPDNNWVNEVCKIGQMHDCCRYLTMAPDGWSCEKHSPLHVHLDLRVAQKTITARGDNCPGKDAR